MSTLKVSNSTVQEKETWKDVKGYEGLYKISSHGRVLSNKSSKPRFLKCSPNRYGYKSTSLWKNRKEKFFYVHSLVALHFLPKPDGVIGNGGDEYTVNHIDGDKLNNYYRNLEYITRSDNLSHGWENGLFDNR